MKLGSLYILAILFFLAVFSKEWLVFNEEALLILNFFLLLFCAYTYLSETIEGFLDEQSTLVKNSFKDLFWMSKHNSANLKEAYSKVWDIDQAVLDTSKVVYANSLALTSQYQSLIQNYFSFGIESSLRSLYIEEINLLKSIFIKKAYLIRTNLIESLTTNLDLDYVVQRSATRLLNK